MASLMEDLLDVLEKECVQYEALVGTSAEKTPFIVQGDIEKIQEYTDIEQRHLDEIANLEKKRVEVIGDMANVLNRTVEEMTITNLIDMIQKQPEEQTRLRELRERLLTVTTKMKEVNEKNKLLVEQSIELVEFDMNLIRGLRQAPETNNYDRNASNIGEIYTGSTSFDAKQ